MSDSEDLPITEPNRLTLERVIELMPLFRKKNGNSNILIAFFLGQELGVDLFGGTLRDYFRSRKSNDIDLIMLSKPEFGIVYDTKTRTFCDQLFEKINGIFGNRLERKTETDPTTTKIWNRNAYVQTFDDTEIVDFELDSSCWDFNKFTILNDHVEYIFVFESEEIKMDITFVKDFEPIFKFKDFSNCTCVEDSLHLTLTSDSISGINFNSKPEKVCKKMHNFVNKNVKTFLITESVDQIVSNCVREIINVINLETLKNALKLVRFRDQGCDIRLKMDLELFLSNALKIRKSGTSEEEDLGIHNLTQWIIGDKPPIIKAKAAKKIWKPKQKIVSPKKDDVVQKKIWVPAEMLTKKVEQGVSYKSMLMKNKIEI